MQHHDKKTSLVGTNPSPPTPQQLAPTTPTMTEMVRQSNDLERSETTKTKTTKTTRRVTRGESDHVREMNGSLYFSHGRNIGGATEDDKCLDGDGRCQGNADSKDRNFNNNAG